MVSLTAICDAKLQNLLFLQITVFAAQVVESKETSDAHSIVGHGCGNQDRHVSSFCFGV